MCLISFQMRALLIACFFIAAASVSAQNPQRNNPYTPSPVAVSQVTPPKASYIPASVKVEQSRNASPKSSDRSVSFAATDIYRIGAGDVIHIDITNSPNGHAFYQVRSNGTIDFPLAGENVTVAGKTTEAVEKMLESAITLYTHPKVKVKVREYASHRVTLSGLVSNGGAIFIRREAVPLYVICADAGVNPKASKVTVRDGRTNAVNTYDLRDANTGNVVINSGDWVEFTSP